jgi:hypothetical protein
MNHAMTFRDHRPATPSLEELIGEADRHQAKLRREEEERQRDYDRGLEELRVEGRRLFDEQEAKRQAESDALREAAERARRDGIEAEVRAAFLAAGGTPAEWEAEKSGVLADDRRRRTVAAAEQDRAFWRDHAARAAGGVGV